MPFNPSKRIVILIDDDDDNGDPTAGLKDERRATNVLLLFRLLLREEPHRVLYIPGRPQREQAQNSLVRYCKNLLCDLLDLQELSTKSGALIEAYSFLVREYRPGDALYFFGGGRGAYTVRALAGLIHAMGILPRDQVNLVEHVVQIYQQQSRQPIRVETEAAPSTECVALLGDTTKSVTPANIEDASQREEVDKENHVNRPRATQSLQPKNSTSNRGSHPLARIVGSQRGVVIQFVGCWDTIASSTAEDEALHDAWVDFNPSVAHFRHALAVDEPRPSVSWSTPNTDSGFPATSMSSTTQVWFPGRHRDVVGGNGSRLAPFSLQWMVQQAQAHGLPIQQRSQLYILHPQQFGGLCSPFPTASATAPMSTCTSGDHPRRVVEGSHTLHESTVHRMKELEDYRPANVLEYYSHDQQQREVGTNTWTKRKGDAFDDAERGVPFGRGVGKRARWASSSRSSI